MWFRVDKSTYWPSFLSVPGYPGNSGENRAPTREETGSTPKEYRVIQDKIELQPVVIGVNQVISNQLIMLFTAEIILVLIILGYRQ